ncbi:MAG: response regulator [Desulfobacterales bacterium]|nr:response regulator [Desulfobacterales bacterium]
MDTDNKTPITYNYKIRQLGTRIGIYKQVKNSSVRPWFIASIAITLFLIMLLGWNLFFSFNVLNSFKNRELAVERASWKLLLYAETMKMTTRVSALSGSLEWKKTYKNTKPRMEELLKEIPLLINSDAISGKTGQIRSYLDNIGRIETRAYELVSRGEKKEALRLLAGWQYTKNQLNFESAVKDLVGLIQERLESKISFQKTRSSVIVVIAAACLAALIFLWSVTIRFWRIQEKNKKRAEADLQKSQEQFRQVQKLESIGRLAGGVAHDLNNMLSPVLGYSEMLLEDNHGDDHQAKALKEIRNASTRARDIVQQLLAFSRRQVLEFAPVDLNFLLKDFESLLRRTIRENISIHMDLASPLPLVKAEAGQLEQVVMNLVINAQDAMPEGGELIIETGLAELDERYAARHKGVSPGEYVMLTVADTGCGMDEQTLENLFEPFYTTKEVGRGTGLGLSTVYGIVKQHGGNIWAYSEPGMGSTFKVYLPVSEDRALSPAQTSQACSDKGGSENILLVEDNRQVRELTFTVLEQQGYTVLTAEKGQEAISLINSCSKEIDMLLTDVVMPEIDGRQLFERLRSIYPDLRVLYMSGYPETVIARHGMMEGGVNFISKPFSVKALAAKVREVLDN